MTITEGGYFIDPRPARSIRRIRPSPPTAENPTEPKTVFGLIVAGLKARRDKGIAPFTVMSCDNIPGNGHRHRECRRRPRAACRTPTFADWIEANVAFPNGMVDRITPATGQREIDLLDGRVRYRGQLAGLLRRVQAMGAGGQVHRRAGRRWKRSASTFVPDVTPYEHMKIRILNGGHAAIAYPAALMDIHFVHDAMEDPLIRALPRQTRE